MDDEQRLVEGLARVLWQRFDVVTAQDPLAALSLLEEHGDFAVVLTDLKMPGMDGLTFLKKVQELSPTTTRLVLTGLIDVNSWSILPGTAFRLVQKPCPAEVLVEIVTDAANYHALLAASPIQPVEIRIASPLLPPAVEVGEVPQSGFTEDGPMGPWQIVDAPLKPRGAPPRAASMPFQGRIGLRLPERTVELLQGSTIVGRSRTCHIPINDPRVSRQHVCFLNDGRELTVRNLAKTNVVLVNGSAIEGAGPHRLEIGDWITIGSRKLQVALLGDYCPSLEPTEQSLAQDRSGQHGSDRSASLIDVADVVAKYVRLGQWQHVERVVRPQLEGLLRYCSAGQEPLPADLDVGVSLALDLAEFNRAGEWITYVFDLLATLGIPASADMIERLYRIVSTTPHISMASYRRYLEALTNKQDQFGAAQRFLVRRIRGLEHVLMISAHN